MIVPGPILPAIGLLAKIAIVWATGIAAVLITVIAPPPGGVGRQACGRSSSERVQLLRFGRTGEHGGLSRV
jgi:hypothetical protein